MKKIMVLLGLLLSTCGCSKVPAGYVGVKVHTMGGSKGVDSEVVGVGYYWLPPTVDLYTFPTFQQNWVWTASPHEGSPHDESMTFQDKDGLQINTDIAISYIIDPAKVAHIFTTYRKGIDEITNVVLRNMVRNAFSAIGGTMKVEDIYGSQKGDLLSKVTAAVNAQIDPIGIHVISIASVGAMRLPEAVQDSLNAKIQATQKALQLENEVAQARAQAEKAIAVARGEAEANRLKNNSITPQLLQYEALQKWDGHTPAVVGGSGNGFLFNLDKVAK